MWHPGYAVSSLGGEGNELWGQGSRSPDPHSEDKAMRLLLGKVSIGSPSG